ncbi:hypothetical protein B0H14DRAFT_3511153 [Mycena olivaceomarginata]|nr:hypothetical protein B0H14DRAFT_3511153 [Mycena olivaceomarginata]
MSSSGFFVTQTVAQAIVIPPLLYVVLDSFQSTEVNRDNYCGSPLGEVAYVRNFLRPFAHVIRSCIPSTVCRPDNMPFVRAAELEKYVLVYIEHAALLYAIAFEVSRRSEQPVRLDLLPSAGTIMGRSQIASLESLELINDWACENTLLQDGIKQTQMLDGLWRNP